MVLTKNIVTKLGELQAQLLELIFDFCAQSMGSRSPEAGNRRAHLGVVLGGELVDVAGVGNLALSRRIDAVNLGACQPLENVDTVFFSKNFFFFAHFSYRNGSLFGLVLERKGPFKEIWVIAIIIAWDSRQLLFHSCLDTIYLKERTYCYYREKYTFSCTHSMFLG